MIRQTDDYANPLGKWGCYVISLLNMGEKLSGIILTPKQAFLLTANAWKAGWIDDKFDIQDPAAIAKSAGANVSFLGKKDKDYLTKPDEMEILEFYNPRTQFTHFVLGDGHGKCAFDPILSSITVKEGKVVAKRIFKLEKK